MSFHFHPNCKENIFAGIFVYRASPVSWMMVFTSDFGILWASDYPNRLYWNREVIFIGNRVSILGFTMLGCSICTSQLQSL